MIPKDLMTELSQDVDGILKTDFTFSPIMQVPSIDDQGLTFVYDGKKKGESLKTCILFADIIDSVKITDEHYTTTIGRMYTAFIKGVLKIAKQTNGVARNIIGDRVMVVFQPDDCCYNALRCAISINHLNSRIINQKFKDIDFHCGIGIHYADCNVMKVGLNTKGQENVENKNLVWIGDTANLASRLTDMAGQTKRYVSYNVTRDFYEPNLIGLGIGGFGSMSFQRRTKSLSADDFAETVSVDANGRMSCSIRNVTQVERKEDKHTFSPILISKAVYDGAKATYSNWEVFTNNMLKKDTHHIDDVDFDVYGGDIRWKIE